MHTGVSSQESLSQVLRNVSQRRRQGVLELRCGERIIHIQFVQGKIVELIEQGSVPAQEVAETLSAAGLIASQHESSFTTYKQVAAALQAAGHMPEGSMKRAVRHRILSKLYTLDLDAPAISNFDSTMIESQRDFAPSISVGQLLLDVVALHSDRSRFLSLFNSTAMISHGEAEPTELSEDENLIYDALSEEQDLVTLRRKAMLSEYALQDALLRLHELRVIALSEKKRSSTEEFLDEKLLSHLDAAIDDVFEEEGFAVDAQMEPDPEPQITTSGVAIIRESSVNELEHENGGFINRGIKRRLALASTRAMHMHWVPALVMALFLLSTLLVPLFLWNRVYESFAG